jgi:predicted DNA binding protein
VTVVVDIAIDAEDFCIGQVLAHTTTRIELTQLIPIDGSLAPYFWKVVDDDREFFERQIRQDDRVRSLTDLDGRVGARLYRIEWTPTINGFLSALQEHDILVEEGQSTSSGDQWSFRIRAGSQTDFASFRQACADSDVVFEIQRVQHNPDTPSPLSSPKARLTTKQCQAVLAALRGGYFEIPRECTQSDIADELEITRQSFARRLTRAQRTVFEDLFWEELTED